MRTGIALGPLTSGWPSEMPPLQQLVQWQRGGQLQAMWQAAAQVGTLACSCGSHFSSGAEAQRLLAHTAMQQMLKGA